MDPKLIDFDILDMVKHVLLGAIWHANMGRYINDTSTIMSLRQKTLLYHT